MCARHVKEFRMSWNPELWTACVQRLWYWRERIGPIQVTVEDLQLFLCVRGSIQEFHKGVNVSCPAFQSWKYKPFLEDCHEKFPEWYEYFILAPAEEHLPLLTKFKDSQIKIIEKKKEEFLKTRKQRCSIVKDQILAVAWHTSRFLRWTLSKEEIADIQERWTIFPPSKPLRSVLEEVW